MAIHSMTVLARLYLFRRRQLWVAALLMIGSTGLVFGEPVAVAEAGAVSSFETEAAKDARLAWWREARFGMFIHWGVYSALAGEWKGQRVEGYSEHVQRLCKIKRADYLEEVVKPFNPAAFDADAWVRTAKEAGMGYIVITAMHHDGVAMYDSKVDDYNVVKTSRFGRDPLRELKTACDRAGIKLGFYYSHAIDWSLSGDPRYPEPNGPARRLACVERKALPQILELIENYHPALLWGDTPHLNPKELNERILLAVRKADTNLIVNGRLAGASHGDYLTTADRPAEFGLMRGPDERDWEAIPTTNESYGYHAFDKSHKPPAHFIRLLAKAAARGGNLLMNFGPRGDGTFAPEDQTILQALTAWWKTNGEAIRGTGRTPLAPQSWGESTLKGNRLYLHVFNWPADGRLLVGGLDAEIIQARLLATSGEKLAFTRLGADVEIRLPARAPDAADSVISLDCAERPRGGGPLLMQPAMPNDLSVFTAELLPAPTSKGSWKLGKGTSLTSHVQGWSKPDYAVRWQARLAEAGTFDVIARYDAPDAKGKTQVDTIGGKMTTTSGLTFGGDVLVSLGTQTLRGQVAETGLDVALPLGRVTLGAGPIEIKVSAGTITGQELMQLKSLRLVPVSP